MLPRYLFYSLLLASVAFARFTGSSSFIVDYSDEDEMESPSTKAPYVEELPLSGGLSEVPEPKKETVVVENSSTMEAPAQQPEGTTAPAVEDGHDPMEVVEAAIDLVNTPFHRVVGSNPLRRLLRLVAPTKEDFIAGIKMTHDIQKATGQNADIPVATEIPPVINHIFGFHQSEDQLFRKTTTLEPLFPVVPYDHDAVYKYINNVLTSTTQKP